MSSTGSCPLLDYFGAFCKPLTRAEAQAAGFDERVKSIGRLLVREVSKMRRRLSQEGRVSYDAEDLLLEIWIELKEKDHLYDCERGGYRAFALMIARNRFSEIAGRSRSVKLPSDAAAQRKGGDQVKAARISRAAADHEKIYGLDLYDSRPGPDEELSGLEEAERSTRAAADRIGQLSLVECLALEAKGIWGGPTKSLGDAARENGLHPLAMKRALRAAKRKLKPGQCE